MPPSSASPFDFISGLAWSALPPLAAPLGEVCNGIVQIGGRDVLITMGQGANTVYRYDIAAQAYLTPASQRPYAGNHHACDVHANQLFVVGGFGASQEEEEEA